jgi:hypothetical protein
MRKKNTNGKITGIPTVKPKVALSKRLQVESLAGCCWEHISGVPVVRVKVRERRRRERQGVVVRVMMG